MAKRKRLDASIVTNMPNLETKSVPRMPIAEVAGETAGRAALEEVAREMTAAEDEGRIVKKLPLERIVTRHLSRDRMEFDKDEMAALTASIAERGQQTPIEVLRLPDGAYGLISGLRRIEALAALGDSTVLALIKQPSGSQEAYRAMVEENEIRAGLSFYERANIVVVAVEQGVYPDVQAAVKGLFAHAALAKRSKILNFVTLREALGPSLGFPTHIPEHLGLALAKAATGDAGFARRVRAALKAAAPRTAAEERAVLEGQLKGPKAAPSKAEIAPGVTLETRAGRAVLSGKAVNSDFQAELRAWVISRAKSTSS